MPDPKEESLDTLERWMQEVISHPGGVEEGLQSDAARRYIASANKDLESVILPSKALSAKERLGIYANMYYWRFVDILAETYATVRHLVGADAFYDLAVRYIELHPSTSYTLDRLGDAFPSYLLTEASNLPHREFASQVATLEHTIEVVFGAKRSDVLDIETLLGVAPERWAQARFVPIDASELLAFDYPVNRYYQALRNDAPILIPDAEPSWVVVYRKNYRVWRQTLNLERFTILSKLREGGTLAEALEACLELDGIAPETLLGSLQEWFRDWTGEGIFARIELPD